MSDREKSVVRVWHGAPRSENGAKKFVGTAFFVDTHHVITAKHVITQPDGEHLYPTDEIYLTTDTGAWAGGGGRYINNPIVPDAATDIAILPLKKPAEGACCLPLADATFELKPTLKVKYIGYGTPNEAIEKSDLAICSYNGSFDLEVANQFIAKGLSGSPVLYDGKLVAVLRARDTDANKTYLIRLNTFRSFLHQIIGNPYQPIWPDELAQLKTIINPDVIPFELADGLFREILPGSASHEANGTAGILDFIAKKAHTPPHKAPLLEYIEQIQANHKKFDPSQVDKLEKWKAEIASRLEIDLESVRLRVQSACADKTDESPIILVKIEPKGKIDKERFHMAAWLYIHGSFTPYKTSSTEFLNRDELKKEFIAIIRQPIRQNSSATAPRIECILPICLFDWNPNEIDIPRGSQTTCWLGTRFPLVIRSWDRIYHPDYDFCRNEWGGKWNSAPMIDPQQIHSITDMPASFDALWRDLDSDVRVFLNLCQLPNNDADWKKIMGNALAVGIPHIFWPLSEKWDCESLLQALNEQLFRYEQRHWPDKVHQQRKTQPDWNHIAMLWDDPTLQPPDAGAFVQLQIE